MITMNANTGISRQKNNNVTFEKSPKQIIAEAPNKELQKIIKFATSGKTDTVLEIGIPDLLNYAKKGKSQKQEAVSIFRDMIDSKELREDPSRQNLFYGYKGFEDEYPGYVQAYERLTGQKLNVRI